MLKHLRPHSTPSNTSGTITPAPWALVCRYCTKRVYSHRSYTGEFKLRELVLERGQRETMGARAARHEP
ncbi:hypothetical protein ACLOJK_016939 [Asimina triloba]